MIEYFNKAKEIYGREWPKVKNARKSFFTLLGIGCFATATAAWTIVRLIYLSEITGLETARKVDASTIANQAADLAKLRSETGATTTPEALYKLNSLQDELRKLRAETDATITFSAPEWIAKDGGIYLIRSTMTINSATPRSGLTIGITTEYFDELKVVGATEGVITYGPYTHPTAWLELGSKRYHFRNVNGAYIIEIKLKEVAPVVIGYILEGKEGKGIQYVTWKVP